jgi:hypothetical protein
MEKALFFLFTLSIVLVQCKKENNNSNSPDLQKYVIRNNPNFGSGSATKIVPNEGQISTPFNSLVACYDTTNHCSLSLQNYSDTSWVGFEHWAFQRELISVKFDGFYNGKQKILDYNAYKSDKIVNYAAYYLWHDDVPAAQWNINLEEDNYIIVTKLDTSTNIIEGDFSLNFIKDGNIVSGTGLVYSNIIQFHNGKFRSKIY